MVEYYITLGMDWLHYYCASIYYSTRLVHFQFSNKLVLEWKGNSLEPMGQFISYVKPRRMIFMGCIYHLVFVMDSRSKTQTLELVQVVK